MTWLMVMICAQDCIRNPYLIAKLIEVLFVIVASLNVSFTTVQLIINCVIHPT